MHRRSLFKFLASAPLCLVVPMLPTKKVGPFAEALNRVLSRLSRDDLDELARMRVALEMVGYEKI